MHVGASYIDDVYIILPEHFEQSLKSFSIFINHQITPKSEQNIKFALYEDHVKSKWRREKTGVIVKGTLYCILKIARRIVWESRWQLQIVKETVKWKY